MFGLYKKFGLSCFVYQLTPFTDRVRLCAMPPICSVYRVPTDRLRLYLFLNLRVGLRQIVEQIINQQEAKLQEDSSYTVRQTETTSGGGYRTCYADENLRKKKKQTKNEYPCPYDFIYTRLWHLKSDHALPLSVLGVVSLLWCVSHSFLDVVVWCILEVKANIFVATSQRTRSGILGTNSKPLVPIPRDLLFFFSRIFNSDYC